MFILFQSGGLNVKPDKTQVFLENSHVLFESQQNLLCWETK